MKTINERFSEHIKASKRKNCKNRPLYRAFNKYGVNNFSIEVIEECNNSNLLSEREIFWIDFYNTYSNGYNATRGGDGKPYIDVAQIIKYYKKYKNCHIVSELLGVNYGYLREILNRNNIDTKDYTSRPRKNSFCEIPRFIDMFSKQNEYFCTFKSIGECAQYLLDNNLSKARFGDLTTHIYQVCNGERKTAYGFVWKYKNFFKKNKKNA